MRVRAAKAFALLILGAFAATASAQQPASLDAPVHDFKLPRELPECGLEAVLRRLAQETDVRIGFERTTLCNGHHALGFS